MLILVGGQPVETQTTNEMIRLPDVPMENWKATEIVYSRISIEVDDDKGFLFRAAINSQVIDSTDIAAFIESLKAGATPNDKPRAPRKPDLGETETPSALDILVEHPCYVVVQLDTDSVKNWQFRTNDVGLTSKLDYGRSNFGLRHVNADANTPDQPSDNGCAIIYFCVNHRQAKERQHFNLHVEFTGQDADANGTPTNSIQIIIDPDVPNNGGQF